MQRSNENKDEEMSYPKRAFTASLFIAHATASTTVGGLARDHVRTEWASKTYWSCRAVTFCFYCGRSPMVATGAVVAVRASFLVGVLALCVA
jgi:hypothetical protein